MNSPQLPTPKSHLNIFFADSVSPITLPDYSDDSAKTISSARSSSFGQQPVVMLLPTHTTGVRILIHVGIRGDVVISSFSQHLFAMPLSTPTMDVSVLSPHRHAHAPELPLVGDVLPPLPFKSSPGAEHHSFHDHAKFIPSFETVKPTPPSSPINNNNNALPLPPLTLSMSNIVLLPHRTCTMQTSHRHITAYTDASHPCSSNSLLLPHHHTHPCKSSSSTLVHVKIQNR